MRIDMMSARAAYKSGLEQCSRLVNNLSNTFTSLNLRQESGDLEDTNFILRGLDHKLSSAQSELLSARDLAMDEIDTELDQKTADLKTRDAELEAANLKISSIQQQLAELSIARAVPQSSASILPNVIPAQLLAGSNATHGVLPGTPNVTFDAGQQLPTPASAAEPARTKRVQPTSPTKPQPNPKRVRQSANATASVSASTSMAESAQRDQQEIEAMQSPLSTKTDGEITTDKIYGMFDFEGGWTDEDKDLFYQQIESWCTRRPKPFEDRRKAIDKHAIGRFDREPPDPRPCLIGQVTSSKRGFGPGGPSMSWENCPFCEGNEKRRCISAKFAAGVGNLFGERIDGVISSGQGYTVQDPMTVFLQEKDIRWIATIRPANTTNDQAPT